MGRYKNRKSWELIFENELKYICPLGRLLRNLALIN